MALIKDVSVFQNIKNSRTPIDLSTNCTLEYILQSRENKYKVELLRQLEKGSKEYLEIKESLPAFTPSGTFSTRCKTGLIEHSGVICLDFDNLESPAEFRDSLKQYDFIAYASLSCSGNGVFALVEIAYPELHTRYYEALEAFFAEKGVAIDPSCKDVCRLRIASWDDRAWYKEQSEKWNTVLPPKPIPEYKPRTSYEGDIDQKLFLVGLDYIEKHGIDCTAGRSRWIGLAVLVNNLFGASGEAYFQALSRYHIKYDEGKTRKVYADCTGRTSYGIGVFVNACKRANMPDLRTLFVESRKGEVVYD